MQSQLQVDLREAVTTLLCDGSPKSLRRHYTEVNKKPDIKKQVNHHGVIHRDMVVMPARVLGPHLGLKVTDEFDEQAVVEMSCLLHDVGLSHGRPRHAINGAAMVEDILNPFEVDEQTIAIVRLLVRFHRADDLVWLDEQILPRWEYVLGRLREGDRLYDVVKTNDPDEDPSQEEVRDFLELMSSGIPMLRMLDVLMLADCMDIGRPRVRQKQRQAFYPHLEAARRCRLTLSDILKKRGVEYSQYDLANFAVTKMEVILQDDLGQDTARILVQGTSSPVPKSRKKRQPHIQHHPDGLFVWARRFSHMEESKRRQTLGAPLPWLRSTTEAGTPTTLILRAVLDQQVCEIGEFEEIKKTYLAAIGAAARHCRLNPTKQFQADM